MTATSTLLAALIAASTTTNGVITVGDTQPFDQVRLYQNPANSTVLTNQSSDGSIDTSTTALVITGATAPTGLVFQPNLAVLRNVTSDIKLLVDTSVELTLNVNIAGTLTAMTVEAGKTAVLTLALIAGIPMIVGSHGFFLVASPSNDAGTGLLLVPNGADESADGEFQRFVWDGEHVFSLPSNDWSAKLATEDRADAYSIKMKMPTIVDDMPLIAIYVGDVASYAAITDGSDGNRVTLEAVYVADNSATELRLYAQSFLGGEYAFTDTLIIPAPAAGTVITLEVTQSSAVMSWGSESYPLAITSGLLPALSDVLVYSTSTDVPLPLSIKVAQVDEA